MNYNLKEIADKIALEAGSKARLDKKFNLIYLIPNVVEQILLDVGFIYTGLSLGGTNPTYQMGNIFATYEGSILHVKQDATI